MTYSHLWIFFMDCIKMTIIFKMTIYHQWESLDLGAYSMFVMPRDKLWLIMRWFVILYVRFHVITTFSHLFELSIICIGISDEEPKFMLNNYWVLFVSILSEVIGYSCHQMKRSFNYLQLFEHSKLKIKAKQTIKHTTKKM